MKITKDLEPNWKNESSLQLFNVLKVKLVILMDDLNKDEHIHDREDHKKLPHHPPSSSNVGLLQKLLKKLGLLPG